MRLQRELARLRRTIDGLDDELVGLLEQRAQAAREIGELKARAGLPVEVPRREQQIIARVTRSADVLPPAALRRVFRTVICESRRLQREQRE